MGTVDTGRCVGLSMGTILTEHGALLWKILSRFLLAQPENASRELRFLDKRAPTGFM